MSKVLPWWCSKCHKVFHYDETSRKEVEPFYEWRSGKMENHVYVITCTHCGEKIII